MGAAAAPEAEVNHTRYVCDKVDCHPCQFCEGGLFWCTVCNGFEGTLTTDCSGRNNTEVEHDAIYKTKTLDYRADHGWVNPQCDDLFEQGGVKPARRFQVGDHVRVKGVPAGHELGVVRWITKPGMPGESYTVELERAFDERGEWIERIHLSRSDVSMV